MNKRTTGYVVALLCVIALGVWQLGSKRQFLSSGTFSNALSELLGRPRTQPAVHHQENHPPEEDAFDGAPVSLPAPIIAESTAEEMFPFPADAPLLETTVSLPEKRLPLVYVAYCLNSEGKKTTETQLFNNALKFQMRAAPGGKRLVNVLPNSAMLLAKRRAFEDLPGEATTEEYLQDAQDEGADFFVKAVFDGSLAAPNINLQLVDLHSSATATWSSTQAGLSSAHDIIVTSAKEALKFTGASEEDLSSPGFALGTPQDATLAQLAVTSDQNYEWMTKLCESDPQCSFLYMIELGTTSPAQHVNAGLHKFPQDHRLYPEKVRALMSAQTTDTMVRFLSEAIRRNPDDIYNFVEIDCWLSQIFPHGVISRETPQVFKTCLKQAQELVHRYPDTMILQWTLASGLRNLASYMRGTHTINRIPDSILMERQVYVSAAYSIMEPLVRKYQHNPRLLTSFLEYNGDVGALDYWDERRLIEKVAELDPRQVYAEKTAAAAHSIGYGNQKEYFTIMDAAFKRHAGDAVATADLANALAYELSRQVGWKQMTKDQAYGEPNPYANRLLKVAEFIYSKGKTIGWEGDWIYMDMVKRRGNAAVLADWEKTGQNPTYAFQRAEECYRASDWENCLRFARAALPFTPDDRCGHLCRYYEVKCLWKLKRYEESMKAARQGIMAYPKEQTFPYMYAVVALESGQNLDIAYDCAYRAVDLGTGNVGCNETFEKIRKKLGKPDHPALVKLLAGK